MSKTYKNNTMNISIIKYLKYLVPFVLVFLIQTNCTHKSKDLREPCDVEIATVDELALLTEYLGKQGAIINRNKDEFFISANDLYKSLDKNILIIDIRKVGDYNRGFIKNAIHLDTKKLYYFFHEKLHPFKYDKIVLVCYSGQSAAYNTAILQLLGFDNVCTLKWGMSAWNKETANKKWLKKLNNISMNKLGNNSKDIDKDYNLPLLSTGKNKGIDVLNERAKKILTAGYSNASINLNKISEADSYHFIQYSKENVYKAQHPKGVKLYKCFNSLICTADLKSLPAEKPIVVLSEFGQDGAMITAYLKLLGYQVRNLNYGVQNYMHSKLIRSNGQYFHRGLIKNYPVEKLDLKKAAPVEEDEGGC